MSKPPLNLRSSFTCNALYIDEKPWKYSVVVAVRGYSGCPRVPAPMINPALMFGWATVSTPDKTPKPKSLFSAHLPHLETGSSHLNCSAIHEFAKDPGPTTRCRSLPLEACPTVSGFAAAPGPRRSWDRATTRGHTREPPPAVFPPCAARLRRRPAFARSAAWPRHRWEKR